MKYVISRGQKALPHFWYLPESSVVFLKRSHINYRPIKWTGRRQTYLSFVTFSKSASDRNKCVLSSSQVTRCQVEGYNEFIAATAIWRMSGVFFSSFFSWTQNERCKTRNHSWLLGDGWGSWKLPKFILKAFNHISKWSHLGFLHPQSLIFHARKLLQIRFSLSSTHFRFMTFNVVFPGWMKIVLFALDTLMKYSPPAFVRDDRTFIPLIFDFLT